MHTIELGRSANGRQHAMSFGTLIFAILTALLAAACSGGGGGSSSSNSGTGNGTVGGAPIIVAQPQSVRVGDGQSASFSVTAVSSVAASYQWARKGVAIPGATTSTYTIPAVQLSDDGATFTVTVSNSAGSIQSAAATLNVSPVAPTLANNTPSTVSVLAGQPATFTVVASGSLPLTFQWRRGGVAIAGANSASYTLPSTAAADNGATFDVVVSNVAGTVTSAIFTLNVTAQPQAPSITTQPASQTVRVGNRATFTVAAGGTGPFTYQWLRNGVAIAGAQASTFTIASTMAGDDGAQFSVVVTNTVGSVTSAVATLTVAPQSALALVAGNIGGAGTIDGAGTAARFSAPSSIAVDNGGNLYVADTSTVRKITASGAVSTFAGLATATGSADGPGVDARFGVVAAVAVDGSGNVFVADRFNHTVRKITATGTVTTFAGTTGAPGSADGTGGAARFNAPSGIATDSAGNIYVADTGNQTIRKITPAGVVTTLAGAPGVAGSADGIAGAASFNGPSALVVDSAGNVYVADRNNSTVRKITPAGAVTTLAGTAGATGASDGSGAAARFNLPTGIAVDAAGNVYVGDGPNDTIRKVTAAGVVTTVAGSPGVNGAADGTGAAASFSTATGLASDGSGTLYVADRDNFTVRVVTTGGVVTTLAGAAQVRGAADGTGGAATFNLPYGIAVDAAGNLYVGDGGNNTVRKIASGGVVTTLAGTAGQPGAADGAGAAARFGAIRSLAVNGAGIVYVADYSNNTIRAITAAGNVTTLAGNPALTGSADGSGAAATFNGPSGVAVDGSGNVFVTDTINGTVRRVTAAGVVTTLAGTAGRIGSADGTGAAASFNLPTGITVDAAGNLYVVDSGTNIVRKVTSTGVVTTIAGTANVSGGSDGAAVSASFRSPTGIAVDRSGNIYVSDTGNRTIRKLDNFGVVTTVAGAADGRAGVRLGTLPGSLNQPFQLAFDSAGNLYLTDVNAVLMIPTP